LRKGATLNVAAPGVLANDVEVDGLALTAIQVSGPLHGTLTLNANGSFAYVHDGSETTSDSFTYKASDGRSTRTRSRCRSRLRRSTIRESRTTTVRIRSFRARRSPFQPRDFSRTTPDIDSTTVTAIKVTNAAHGTVTVNANGLVHVRARQLLTLTDSFTYKVNGGTADSNVATVTLSITPSNQPPVATNDSYSVAEGATLTMASPGVLANDTDPNLRRHAHGGPREQHHAWNADAQSERLVHLCP
jgi:VCBS repeat-containing protein